MIFYLNASLFRNCICKEQAHVSQTRGFVQDRSTPKYFKVSLCIIDEMLSIYIVAEFMRIKVK